METAIINKEKKHPYEGKYVIVRSNGSGVHAGYLEAYDASTQHVFLSDSSRLCRWSGFSLSAVANEGMHDDKALICQKVPTIMITNVLELIPCSQKSEENISKYKVFRPINTAE